MAGLSKTSQWYPGHGFAEVMLYTRDKETKQVTSKGQILKQLLREDLNARRVEPSKADYDSLNHPLPPNSVQVIRIISPAQRISEDDEDDADRRDRFEDCDFLDSLFEWNAFPINSVRDCFTKRETSFVQILAGDEDEVRGVNVAFSFRARHICVHWRHDSAKRSTRVVLIRFEEPKLKSIQNFGKLMETRMQTLRQCFGHSMLPVLLVTEVARQGVMSLHMEDSRELQAVELNLDFSSANRLSTMHMLRNIGRGSIRHRLGLSAIKQTVERCREINASRYLDDINSSAEDRLMGEHVLLHLANISDLVESDVAYLDYISASVDHQLQAISIITNMTDSTSMKTIAVLTLMFLPATFVATIFALPVFPATAPDLFWVYWVVSAPLTVIVVALWLGWWWWRISQRKGNDPFNRSILKHMVHSETPRTRRRDTIADLTALARQRASRKFDRAWLDGSFYTSETHQASKRANMV